MMNDDKKWPQNFYGKTNEFSMSINNSTQTFYNSVKHGADDCQQCYYQAEDKKNDEENYPQSFYKHNQQIK